MKRILFVGASGYGNVGDDAYVMLYRRNLGGHKIMVCNSDLPSALPDCDLVIIGGGGLLHVAHEHLDKMTWYLRQAETRGIPYGFSSVGFQYDPRVLGVSWQTEKVAVWQPWLAKAKFITVRSPKDREKMESFGAVSEYFPDLCYLMRDLIPSDLVCDPKRLVLIPGAGVFRYDANATSMPALQEACIQRFVAGWQLVGGNLQVVRMGAPVDTVIHLKRLRALYKNVPVYEAGDPKECLRLIAGAGQVLSGRYHGMLFARCAGVPCWTAPLAPWKIMSEDAHVDPGAAVGHLETIRKHL